MNRKLSPMLDPFLVIVGALYIVIALYGVYVVLRLVGCVHG